MSDSEFVPLTHERLPEEEMQQRAVALAAELDTRRSVRHFSPEPVPLAVLDECVRAASTAPSGAHQQPWTFALVTEPALKARIRAAAEEEERANYGGRMNDEWLDDLAPLGTDADKPFLETAPCLVILFRQAWGELPDGTRKQHYYTQESVGIAAGFLLAALHRAGLATLTHTPSPMGFLGEALGRPENEKAFLLVPVGYPAEGCEVPDLERKPLDEVLVRFD